MRFGGFRMVVAVCVIVFFGGAAWAGRGQALGSVVQASNAFVDSQAALAGADVYACDVLNTDSFGELRAQFQRSQLVLGTSSQVVLDGNPGAVHAIVVSGSISFSAPSSTALIIDTPAGTLREASGQTYTGTVAITGPKELIVSAVRGEIVLNSGGTLHTVPAGKSARVTFDQAADTSCHAPGYVRNAYGRRKIGFYILGGAVAGGAGYVTWKELTESETKPD
jgi:hypothetical protein